MQPLQAKPVESRHFTQTQNIPSGGTAFQRGVANIAKVIVIEKEIDVFGDEHDVEKVMDSTQSLSRWLTCDMNTGHSNSLHNRILAVNHTLRSFLGNNKNMYELPENEKVEILSNIK